MKPALVTGATGFVGWHVAHLLLERGIPVRALARDPVRLEQLDGAEPVRGDLRDPASLDRAVAGCGTVYHVAADYRLWARDQQAMYESNVAGTRNLLEAARRAGVQRIVYTSTVGCIGVPAGGIGDETLPIALEQMSGAYKRSKFMAEQVALQAAGAGLPVVIVNPTAPVGERDVKPTPTGRVVLDYLKGGMPAYIDTGLNLVDVRDAALGHLLAAEHGRPGERYILGSRNLDLIEIFRLLEPLAGIKAPQVRIPYGVAYAAAVCSTAWARIFGSEPRAPLDAVRMAKKKMFVTHAKAERELGYRPAAAVEDALRRAVEWFRNNRYC